MTARSEIPNMRTGQSTLGGAWGVASRAAGVCAAAALLATAACNNDNLTSVNNNPNSPTAVPVATLFTAAARSTVGRWLGNGYDLRGTEWVAQHLAEVQYPDEDDYKRLQGPQTTAWFDAPYENELEDLRKIVQAGMADKKPGTWAPALILQVYGFSYLTNTWGDVPYFQTLIGDSSDAVLTPAYDKQQAIFTNFFVKLDSASKALTGAENTLGGADPIYGGDPASWQKFANSLRLRLAMQLANVDPTTTATQVGAALTAPGGVFTSNDDMAMLGWPGDGVYDNPWSQNFQTRDDHRMSQTLMNIIVPAGDPRVPVFAQPTHADPTKYAGMPNGLTQSTAAPYFNISSRPGEIFYPGVTAYGVFSNAGKVQPSYLMTYAEVAFLEAEAAERGFGGLTAGQAKGFYEAAITASMNQLHVTDQSAINAYLANANVAYKGGTAGLTQIAIQEWVALYTDGGQAWALWRRTCAPATLKPGPNAITAEVIRRFQYSTTERSVNGAQLDAAIAQMGGNSFLTRMYWDTKPTAAPTYTQGCGVR